MIPILPTATSTPTMKNATTLKTSPISSAKTTTTTTSSSTTSSGIIPTNNPIFNYTFGNNLFGENKLIGSMNANIFHLHLYIGHFYQFESSISWIVDFPNLRALLIVSK
jgi:hypothetical protein